MFKVFLSDERGTETVEWAIMAGLIVTGLLGVVVAIGGLVKSRFGELQTVLEEG